MSSEPFPTDRLLHRPPSVVGGVCFACDCLSPWAGDHQAGARGAAAAGGGAGGRSSTALAAAVCHRQGQPHAGPVPAETRGEHCRGHGAVQGKGRLASLGWWELSQGVTAALGAFLRGVGLLLPRSQVAAPWVAGFLCAEWLLSCFHVMP